MQLEASWTGEVLTLEEAAKLLQIEARTLRRWIAQKDVPYMRLGRLVRLRRSSLMAWIVEQERVTMAAKRGNTTGETR